ncbi:MAG: PQQ-like beta-propeller repeat protein, partial [Planctomycetes bacterium]|nr:PQQ-like beta-propeller repeat protein [Planctomycetota bacterium]
IMFSSFCSVSFAQNWDQFRGPTRNGKSAETGFLKVWPESGPQELWSFDELGAGYSTAMIVDDTIYVTGIEGDGRSTAAPAKGLLFALDMNGNLKWKVNYGGEANRKIGANYPGPRTTPTYDNGKLYLMSGLGVISCHDAKNGEKIWSVDTLEKYHGKNIKWAIAESVLIDRDNVICTPGGKDASIVALNKNTGQTIWTSKGLSDLSGYCSPIIIKRGPNRLLVTMLAKSVVAVNPDDGVKYWEFPHEVSYDINANTPLHYDGCLYYSNGYRHGGFMIELSPDGADYTKKWTEETLDVHHGNVIELFGNIYGAGSRSWICLDFKTGRIKKDEKGVGKGSVTYADGMLYCYGERGTLGLAKVTPDGFEFVSQFKITKGTKEHWAHPVVHNGRLYIRHGDTLMCYDIKAK